MRSPSSSRTCSNRPASSRADRLAAARGRAGQGSLAQALVDEGLATSEGVARARAERYQLPFVDVGSLNVSPGAVEQIPLAVLQRIDALPYQIDGSILRVAIADPGNIPGIDQLRLATRLSVELAVAPREDLLAELQRFGRTSEAFAGPSAVDLEEFEVVEEEDDLEQEDGVSDAPIVRLVNSLIFQAAEDGASDVHIEPQEDCLLVRFRIDGVLHETQRIPKRLSNAVTTRLKVLAKMDIAERRRPQDGRISLNAVAAGRRLDVRIATLPTVEGESVVMRLLDKSKKAPTLEELGLSLAMREELSAIVRKPTGALLVTGPTGSGKSTTLYAALSEINRPEINIITVEDPVEYRLAGVNQVQINPKAGLTFGGALRSILRSDPDVVMVGEIRDGETAKISIEAALTGHFVLSTLHTNDAPSAITRLNEMGVEPFLVGAAVSAVLAQRLARRLCGALLRDVHPDRRRSDAGPGLSRGCRTSRRHGLLPQAWLPALQPERLPRPGRRLPALDDVGGARDARRHTSLARRDRACRVPQRHARPLGRWGRKGGLRAHLAGRARPRRLELSLHGRRPASGVTT